MILLAMAGASLTLPEGFEGKEAASKYDPSYCYAEKGGGKVAKIMTQATRLKIDSTTDYSKLGDDVLDGRVSSAGIQEILEGETIATRSCQDSCRGKESQKGSQAEEEKARLAD